MLLCAVGVDVWNKSQGRPSIIGFLTRDRKTMVKEPGNTTVEAPRSDTPDATRPLVPAP